MAKLFEELKNNECSEKLLHYSELNSHIVKPNNSQEECIEPCNESLGNNDGAPPLYMDTNGVIPTEKKKKSRFCGKREEPITCPQCGIIFSFQRHYHKHMEGHKKNNCKYCDTLNTTRKRLVNHMAEMHKDIKIHEAKFKCEYCNKCFIKPLSLYNHYNCHARGQFVCSLCGRFYKNKEEFDSHKQKHELEKQWKCEECNESFYRRQQYLFHISSHEKYKCSICSKGFSTKKKVIYHKLEVHQQKSSSRPHQCSICEHNFSRPCLLRIHYQTHQKERKKNLSCKPCGKTFVTRKKYFTHLQTARHMEALGIPLEELFTCTTCKKVFTKKSLLNSHIARTHMAVKVFKCSLCDYTASCRNNLNRHMLIHEDTKQFVCERCGATFHSINTLNDHYTYIHSQQRDYRCNICSKSFKRNCGLNRHLRTHSESRPFKCHCGVTYKRAAHLKRHEILAHSKMVKPKKARRVEDSTPILEEPQTFTDVVLSPNSPITLWADGAKETLIDSQILSLMKPDMGNMVAERELCNGDSIVLSHKSVEASQEGGFAADVMHTIEVSYDLNFAVTDTLTLAAAAAPHIVFTSPLSVSLDDPHTVLTIPDLETHETQLLHHHDTLKQDDIFSTHIKAGNSDLLDMSAMSHISSSPPLYFNSPLVVSCDSSSLMSGLNQPLDSIISLHTELPSLDSLALSDNDLVLQQPLDPGSISPLLLSDHDLLLQEDSTNMPAMLIADADIMLQQAVDSISSANTPLPPAQTIHRSIPSLLVPSISDDVAHVIDFVPSRSAPLPPAQTIHRSIPPVHNSQGLSSLPHYLSHQYSFPNV